MKTPKKKTTAKAPRRKGKKPGEHRTPNIELRTSKGGLTARQERFAVLSLNSKKPAAELYRECFGRVKGAAASASRLLTSANFVARVAALRQAAAAGAVLTLAEKREFLRRVVVTPIGEVDEKSDLCQVFEVSDTGRKYKVPDKLRAIELDARFAGELEPAPQVNVAGDVNLLVTPELLAALQARRKAALKL